MQREGADLPLVQGHRPVPATAATTRASTAASALTEIISHSRTIKIDPNLATAHCALGLALNAEKKYPVWAIREFQVAIKIDPNYAMAHYNLGLALVQSGNLPEAAAAFQKAAALKPDLAEAHCNLGHALVEQGEFKKALEPLRRGHKLGFRSPRWRYPSAQWVRECERLVELDGKLPRFLKGKPTPASPAEHIELAGLCSLKRLNRAAARFYEEAFAAEPRLADDLVAGHRYKAAGAAALAGCGQGKDADKLDGEECARLRRQALGWLRADLDAFGRLLDKEPDQSQPAARITSTLSYRLVDPNFAGMRGPPALAKLPDAERQPWQNLWGHITVTLARALAKSTPEKKLGPK